MNQGPATAASLKPPPPTLYRWVVLVVISLAMFGNYYVYDAVSPIADLLKEQLGFSDSNIGLLNAIYSFPNIVMVLIGGILIDRIGVKKATLLFGVLCFLGAAVTAVSGNLAMMAAGRLIFGLGAESLIVSVTTAIAKWFRGRELSFAFGANLTIARLGSFLALNSPTWARPAFENWQWPLLIAVAFGTLCVVGAIIYWVMEERAAKAYDLGETGKTEKVVFADLFRFPRAYIYVVLLCVTFYSAIFPFQTFAVKFFIEAHGTTREFGGFLSSMITLFAMVFTPLFGYVVDRVGKRALFMMWGPRLPDDGVHGCRPARPDGDDGHRVLARTRGDVAVGGISGRRSPARNGIRLHDHDPEYRTLRVQPADRVGQRHLGCQCSEPGRLCARDVDLLDPRLPRLLLRLAASKAGDRPRRARVGDDHSEVDPRSGSTEASGGVTEASGGEGQATKPDALFPRPSELSCLVRSRVSPERRWSPS
jgi:MFS family permease